MNEKTANQKTVSDALGVNTDDNTKKSKFRNAVIKTLAYSIPLAVLAGAGAYGATKLKSLRDMLLDPNQDLYSMKNERIKFVDSIKLL
jgi:hypothetical protein